MKCPKCGDDRHGVVTHAPVRRLQCLGCCHVWTVEVEAPDRVAELEERLERLERHVQVSNELIQQWADSTRNHVQSNFELVIKAFQEIDRKLEQLENRGT